MGDISISSIQTRIGNLWGEISGAYAIVYIILLHTMAIMFIGFGRIDFSKPMADVVLGYVAIILEFIVADFAFLIPSLMLIALGTMVSFLMAISVPLFLFLYSFQLMGATSVEVMEYGFVETLSICLIATPIGLMNLRSLKIFS